LSVQFKNKISFFNNPPPSSPTDPACTPPSPPPYSGEANFPAVELPLQVSYCLPPRPQTGDFPTMVPSLLLPLKDSKPLPPRHCSAPLYRASPSSSEFLQRSTSSFPSSWLNLACRDALNRLNRGRLPQLRSPTAVLNLLPSDLLRLPWSIQRVPSTLLVLPRQSSIFMSVSMSTSPCATSSSHASMEIELAASWTGRRGFR
jgi:hypothetical protein